MTEEVLAQDGDRRSAGSGRGQKKCWLRTGIEEVLAQDGDRRNAGSGR